MKTGFSSNRALSYGAVLIGVVLLFAVGLAPLLRLMGSFLVVEDRLRPAGAIVALGGDPPFREMEAARLYRAGWAPKVVVIPGALWEEQQALSKLGIIIPESWEISREVLMREGVPASAIWVVKDNAESNRANR